MRRIHGPLEMTYEGRACRMLVIEADTPGEMEDTQLSARAKGWTDYLDGQVPSDGWYSAWMLKPIETSAAHG